MGEERDSVFNEDVWLRVQVLGDKLVIQAAPNKGEVGEKEALEAVGHIARELRQFGLEIERHTRNSLDDSDDAVDMLVVTGRRLRYLMIVNGQREWLHLYDAGVMFDNGHVPVRIGGYVQDLRGMERPITDEERNKIADIADEYSGSK